MTRLAKAARDMALDSEMSPLGRWVRFHGEKGVVYVAESMWGQGYYTWSDAPDMQTAECYLDPSEAIEAGLRRVAAMR